MGGALLGIDIGTTACKTVLVSQDGRIVDSETDGYPLYVPRHGWAEQAPEDWWSVVTRSITRLTERNSGAAAKLAGVGVSGQMHGLVVLDRDCRVIRRAFLWNDQRTQAQCERIAAAAGGVRGLLSCTNNRMLHQQGPRARGGHEPREARAV
jgi:xylulokinase